MECGPRLEMRIKGDLFTIAFFGSDEFNSKLNNDAKVLLTVVLNMVNRCYSLGTVFIESKV